MKQRVIELIGTFFLTLTVGLSVIPEKLGALTALAIGGVLAIMIYIGGHISGGHYNPAVSLGVFFRKKLKTYDLISYIITQILGATLGALLSLYLLNSAALIPSEVDMPRALVCELLFTFALVLTVLSVATAKGTAGNSFYGAAIGGIVMVGALTVGSISGAVFNPAVALGAAIIGLLSWSNFFPYVLVQLFAAFLASVVFRMTNSE
jgi:aquaporin Z